MGSRSLPLRLTGNWQEKLEFRWQLVLSVKSVREVNSSDSAVGVDLHPQSLDVVGSVGSPGEVREIELDLIPAFIKSHGHRADEGLHSGGALVVGGAEPPSDVLVVQNLDLKGEVFLQLHDPTQS